MRYFCNFDLFGLLYLSALHRKCIPTGIRININIICPQIWLVIRFKVSVIVNPFSKYLLSTLIYVCT